MRGATRAAGGRAGQLWPRPPAPGPGPPPLLLLLAVLLGGAGAQYSSDLCSWKGSGLTHEAHRKEVEQVYLRCSAGTVEWMYPTGALIVNLRPNTFSPSRNLTLCIKPLRGSSGANIYLEKTGELKLLVRDGDLGPGQAPCFGFEQGGLFVEATPQQDISRRTTGFQYELTSRRTGPDLHALLAPCRPCSHTEVLLAVCTSDFVVRGSIQKVTHEPERQESAIHLNVSRLYRQKSRVFRPAPEGEGGGWRGRVSTLLECGVRPGHGEFLFTGHMHFGEAWLGCAPRFKDFQRMYRDAEERGLNPCEMALQLGRHTLHAAPQGSSQGLPDRLIGDAVTCQLSYYIFFKKEMSIGSKLPCRKMPLCLFHTVF
uniref:Meteorin-like protein n=1 Tax=Bos indicus x Bos taurus TaxID=30522 RepID=A0A4W2CBF9_BOBOX